MVTAWQPQISPWWVGNSVACHFTYWTKYATSCSEANEFSEVAFWRQGNRDLSSLLKRKQPSFQQHYILYEDTAYLERRTTKELRGSHRQTPTLKIKAGSQAVSFMHSISSHPEISSSIARLPVPEGRLEGSIMTPLLSCSHSNLPDCSLQRNSKGDSWFVDGQWELLSGGQQSSSPLTPQYTPPPNTHTHHFIKWKSVFMNMEKSKDLSECTNLPHTPFHWVLTAFLGGVRFSKRCRRVF
jgi:hypothetical protein